MKHPKASQLPTQDMLGQQQIAVIPLETFDNALSEVPHAHDAYMLMYVAQADGGDNLIDFRRYAVLPGRIFMVRPGQVHQRELQQEEGTLVVFSEDFLQTTGIAAHDILVLFGAVYQHPFLDLSEQPRQNFEQLTQLMVRELQEPKPSMAVLSRYLFILLHHLLRESHSQIARLTPARYSKMLFELSHLIDKHYKEHRSIVFYAEALGMTAKHLNTICRQSLGTTVADMQHARLLLESKRLLYFSSLSVKEIGYTLGFEDDSYFVRFFKRMAGITPAQLRSGGSESTILQA